MAPFGEPHVGVFVDVNSGQILCNTRITYMKDAILITWWGDVTDESPCQELSYCLHIVNVEDKTKYK